MALWDKAVECLKEKDKQGINFQRADKRAILVDLLDEIQKKKQICIERRLKYKKSSGESVLLYDVFEKIAKWVNKFKEIGDVAMQYDPGHAALPWAGIRFLMQISVNDVQIFGGLVEGLEATCKIVARYAAIESLYLRQPSSVENLLKDAIVATYTSILRFLSKCRRHFDLGLAQRLVRSITQLPETIVQNHLDRIANNDAKVLELTRIVDAEQSQLTGTRQLSMTNDIDSLSNDLHALRTESTDSASKLEELLTSFQDPLVRTVEQVSALSKSLVDSRSASQLKEERLEILQWLSAVQYKKHHQTVSKGLLEGTGLWLLKKSQFLEWRDSSVSSMLWLHGIPGSGKTCLIYRTFFGRNFDLYGCRSFCILLLRKEHSRAPALGSCGSVASCSQAAHVLQSKLVQMESTTAREYRRRKQEADKDGSGIARLDIWETTDHIIKAAAEMPVTMFIDALDECRPDQRYQLLHALDMMLHDSIHLVKVLVSSREDADIVLKLKRSPNIYIKIDDNMHDIDRFVQAEIQKALIDGRLLNGRVSPQLQHLITKTLARKAKGMFLWVSLQIQNLCDGRRIKIKEDLVDELAKLPRSLTEMYSLILDNISQVERHGRTIAETVLRWLICTEDATSETTIAVCSEMSSTGNTNLSVEDILDLCCNLVVFDEAMDTFRFAHLSVQEYLELQSGFTQSEANTFLLERLFRIWIGNWSADQNLVCSYVTRYWVSHYKRLEDRQRRLIFDHHARRFFFDGAQPSEAFSTWAAALGSFTEPAWQRFDWSFKALKGVFGVPGHPPDSMSNHILTRSIDTPLDLACWFGWIEILDHYEMNQQLNLFHLSTTKMMSLAIRYRQTPVLHWVLSRDVRPTDEQLLLAFQLQRREIIQIFLDLDILTENTLISGQNPLILAINHNLRNVAISLLRKGANIECRDETGRTPLFHVILQGDANDLVDHFLQAGADPGAQDIDGDMPFSMSIRLKLQIISRKLLERGFFADSKFRDGEELLRLAFQYCCYYTACLLLLYGVDSMFEDEEIRAEWIQILTSMLLHGPTGAAARGPKKLALNMFGEILPEDAVSQTLLSLAAQLRYDQAFQVLLAMGIDPTCPAVCATRKKPSPLARIHGSTTGEKLSGDNDKSNDMIPELRQGPLAWAALTGNLHLVESILDRGVDPNLKNRKAQTALFFAVQRVEDWNSQAELETEKEAVVRLLLQRGALVNSLDIHGDSVLALALKARHRKLAKVLLEAGAELPSGVIDGVREPFWSSFDQGQEGIRRALLARIGGASLDPTTPPQDSRWSSDPLDLAARLICNGAMRFLGDDV